MIILGVDIGGSGIKGALVDTETGKLVTERIRIATPQPATPEAVANTLKELVSKFPDFTGPVGCGFPATVHHGIAFTAANIDKTWINTPVEKLFSATVKRQCFVLNDADAAGIAEMKFGAGMGNKGVVMMITIGTGLGSAIFVNGKLLPNTELGHLLLNDMIAEHYCSDSARQQQDLGWGKWGKRFNKYLSRLQFLFNPDLIILGGGASKNFEKFKDKIEIRTPVVTAKTLNEAGIIGAAIYAEEQEIAGIDPCNAEPEVCATCSAPETDAKVKNDRTAQ